MKDGMSNDTNGRESPDSRRQCQGDSKIYEVSDQKTIERLIKIGTALSVERNLHELLRMLVEELKFVVSADKASLFLLDRERHELTFFVTSDEELREMRLPLNRKSLAGYVAMTGEILRIDDVYELPEDHPFKFNKEIDKQTGYRSRSILALPMIDHKNERIGVVQLVNKMVNGGTVPFDGEDETLLTAIASQAAVSIENARLYNDIEIFFASFVRALASAIEARDPVTKGHSRRVALYSEAIARAMNCFSDAQLKEILYAAWLHDVGKIGVREHILMKRHKLSEAEMETVRQRFSYIKSARRLQMMEEMLEHAEKDPESARNLKSIRKEKANVIQNELSLIDEYLSFVEAQNKSGYMSEQDKGKLQKIAECTYADPQGASRPYLEPSEMEQLLVERGNLTELERTDMNNHVKFTWDVLREIPFTRELRNVPLYASLHHEKLDGTGYPFGYPADKIPLQARILAIADIYDALTAHDRPYKKALSQGESLDILEDMVQKGNLDRDVFIAFIKNRIYALEDKGNEFAFLDELRSRQERNGGTTSK